MRSSAAPGPRVRAAPPTRGPSRARRRSPQGDDTLRAMAESRPAALPPAQRTVGQLVAESIRFYGDHFWPVLLLGLPFLAIDVISLNSSVTTQTIVAWILGPAICAAYVRACMLLEKAFWSWRAYLVALIVYLPFPVLTRIYVLPGLAWFGLIGLA